MDNTTLAPYFKILAPAPEQKTRLTLKDQAKIPFICDTLSRKSHHHLAITGSSSEIYNRVFLDLIAQHLANDETPAILRDAAFIYLDLNRLLLTSAQSVASAQEFSTACRKLESTYSYVILAINGVEPFFSDEKHLLGNRLKSLLANDQWRIIVTTTSVSQKNLLRFSPLQDVFANVSLSEPNKTDALTILKTFRDQLEDFHQVIIPDETLSYALTMANQYLSGQQTSLDQALRLIDSGAARISRTKQDAQEHKPILANVTLTHIVSHRTQIPLANLQHNKFNACEFIQHMQNHVYGQEAAINSLGPLLQSSRLKLQNKKKPLCSFLFVGPAHVGKTTTACALAEYLFGRKNALLRINLDKTLHATSLADIRVSTQTEELCSTTLLEAIQQSPYAVVLLENINQASAGIIDLFQDIFTAGCTTDQQGNRYDFRHAIIIMTTTLGSERIIDSQPHNSHEAGRAADLMQLVLSNLYTHEPEPTHISSQELGEELRPVLEAYFSSKLLASFHLVPFALLDDVGLEKIMRHQLKMLAKQLESEYEIELSYAPEVLRFLVQEATWHKEATISIDKVLDQHLYSCIAHALTVNPDGRNRAKRLLLQLNDAGHVLRCEFVSANEVLSYKI